jgi:hypothetical protein
LSVPEIVFNCCDAKKRHEVFGALLLFVAWAIAHGLTVESEQVSKSPPTSLGGLSLSRLDPTPRTSKKSQTVA